MPLKGLLIMCTSHRGAMPETQMAMAECARAGANFATSSGISDTALARNIAFDRALEMSEAKGDEMLLFVDDDMAFDVPTAQSLCAHAKRLQAAVSALYILTSGAAAATRVSDGDAWETTRWLTGLGCLAIPRGLLLELRERSTKCKAAHHETHEYCWSGGDTAPPDSKTPGARWWMSEDYRFCQRLGGVILAPLAAGHVKPVPLWPDRTSLEGVANRTALRELEGATG